MLLPSLHYPALLAHQVSTRMYIYMMWFLYFLLRKRNYMIQILTLAEGALLLQHKG